MGKHTPGPWRVNSLYALIETGGGAEIAALHAGHTGSKNETQANARLISAAPELLELLIEALPWVEAHLADPVNKPGVVKAFATRIRALISRIEE